QQQEEPDEPIMLRITVNNQVIYEGDAVTLNRVETIVKNVLSQSDVPVIMQVERGALAGIMVQVMDRAKLGGAEKISVTAVN
ncbi:MAG TPA: biopolymer transporter ExbD, partial [Oceanipulchritudo sp.]|nr:biopolymer transporter ExbD [Oceanipulchritudo sp.]